MFRYGAGVRKGRDLAARIAPAPALCDQAPARCDQAPVSRAKCHQGATNALRVSANPMQNDT